MGGRAMGKVMTMLLVLLALIGCKTKTIVVPETHTEYVKQIQKEITHDTLVLQDSIYHYVNGDTVYLFKYKTVYKSSPVYVERVDTVTTYDLKTVYQTEEIDAPWYEKLLLLISGGIVGTVIYLIVEWIKCR